MIRLDDSAKNDYLKRVSSRGGRLAKNRNRFELLWGLSEAYNLFLSNTDFAIVFDHNSDIDIFKDGLVSFYQLKTRSTNLTINQLIANDGKSGDSIISKLYKLDFSKCEKMAVVSNLHLKNYYSTNELCFSDLSNEDLTKIENDISARLHNSLSPNKMFFLKSDLCVNNPSDTLVGQTANLLSNKNMSELDPVILFNFLQGKVIEKACIETNPKDFEDLLSNYALTFNQLENWIKHYYLSSTNSFNNIISTIDQCFSSDYIKGLKIKNEIRLILNQTMINNDFIKDICRQTKKILIDDSKYNGLTVSEICKNLLQELNFPSEIKEEISKYALIFIALNNISISKGGVYE